MGFLLHFRVGEDSTLIVSFSCLVNLGKVTFCAFVGGRVLFLPQFLLIWRAEPALESLPPFVTCFEIEGSELKFAART
jgi:hypothetical protein